MVKKSPSLRQQLLNEIRRLDSLLIPAHRNEIKSCIARLILHYPMTNMSEDEKTILLEDYIEDLAEFPASIIAKICKEYRIDPKNEFFPKSAKLIDKCKVAIYPLLKKRRTIQEALSDTERRELPKIPEDKLKIMMSELVENLTHAKAEVA